MRLIVYPSNVWLILVLSSLILENTSFSVSSDNTVYSLTLKDTPPSLESDQTSSLLTLKDTPPSLESDQTSSLLTLKDTPPSLESDQTSSLLTLKDTPTSLESDQTSSLLTLKDTPPSLESDQTSSLLTLKDTPPSLESDQTSSLLTLKDTPPSLESDQTSSLLTLKDTPPSLESDQTSSLLTLKDTPSSLDPDETSYLLTLKDTPTLLTVDGISSSFILEKSLSSSVLSSVTHEDTPTSLKPQCTPCLVTDDPLSSLVMKDTPTSLTSDDTLSHLASEDIPVFFQPENSSSSLTKEYEDTPSSLGNTPFSFTSKDTQSSLTTDIVWRLSTAITGDKNVYVGQDLRLTCTLYDDLLEKYTASDITFYFSQPLKRNGDERCVPASSIQVINTTAAMLVIHKVTPGDDGQYTCYVGGSGCLNQRLTLVGAVNVLTEYPLHNVTNFQCVVYNWDESMACTWTHPVTYIHAAHIEVHSSYSLDSQGRYEACPTSVGATGCKWDNFTDAALYLVRVEVINSRTKTAVSKTFTCLTHKNVKPAPVKDLTATTNISTPDCLQLSWTHVKTHRGKIFRIKQLVEDGNFSVRVLADNFSSTTFTSCGYNPYTHHNISVDCYPSPSYAGYWSDPVYIDAWTLMTAPDLGPTTTNGSYTRSPSKCSHGHRNVTVMWQEVEVSARNGVIDSYIIKLGNVTLSTVTEGVYSTTVEIPCDSYSTLTILAHNKGGYSLKPSVLLVPPINFSVSMETNVEVIASNSGENSQTVRVSWEIKEGPKNRSFTVFWCKRQLEQLCKIESQINWSSLPGTRTDDSFSVANSDAEDYLFGISVTDIQKGIASEIFWSECLFTRNPDPDTLPRVKTMSVQSSVESVHISWDKTQCFSQYKVKFTSYMIKWCQTSACNGPDGILNATVPATESSYTVSSLSSNVNYSFTVQPIAYGIVGDEIKPWETALPSSADSTLSLGAILGGLCSGLLVLAVAGLLYKTCSSRRKMLMTLMDDRQFLDIDNAQERALTLPGITTRSVQQQQTISTTAPASECQANHAEGTESPRRDNRGQDHSNFPLKNSFKSGSHRSSVKRLLQCSTDSTGVLAGPSSVEHSSQDLENTDTHDTGRTEAFVSDYVQQNVVASQSDGIRHHELPQTGIELQTIENNNEILKYERNWTHFSNKSENHLRLLQNGYSRLMGNEDIVRDNEFLLYQENNQMDEESVSVDDDFMQSSCNLTDSWSEQTADIQSDHINLCITRLPGCSKSPTLVNSVLQSNVLHSNLPAGQTDTDAEANTRDHLRMMTVNLGEYPRTTEVSVSENLNSVNKMTQNAFYVREQTSPAARISLAEFSAVNELSLHELDGDIVSSSVHNTHGYLPHITSQMLYTGDSFSGHYGSSHLSSNISSDMIHHNLDYIQLRDLPSNISSDMIHHNLDYIQLRDLPSNISSDMIHHNLDYIQLRDLPSNISSDMIHHNLDYIQLRDLPSNISSDMIHHNLDYIQLRDLPSNIRSEELKSYSDISDIQVSHSHISDTQVSHSHISDSQVSHSHISDTQVSYSHISDSQVSYSHISNIQRTNFQKPHPNISYIQELHHHISDTQESHTDISDIQQPLYYISDTQEPLSYISDIQQPLSYISDTQESHTDINDIQQPLSYISDTQESHTDINDIQQPLSYISDTQASHTDISDIQEPYSHISNTYKRSTDYLPNTMITFTS